MLIVRVGGGAAINLEGIADDLAGLAAPFVLVHGANVLRDDLARALGRPPRVLTSASGYASVLSDDDAIDVMLMAYRGLRNGRLVELCQRRGIAAVGLSGLDGRLVEGRRNPAIRVVEGGRTMLVRDSSGKPRSVNTALLSLLLGAGYVPVLTVPISDQDGNAINADNDDVVALLAASLGATRVVGLIEAPGLLDDPADPCSLIRELPRAELAAAEARASGRFKRKLVGLRKLCEGSGAEVRLADGRTAHPLADALAGAGTVIR